MNDPRITQTVAAIGSRLAAQASVVGGGASWITMCARLLPWAAGAVLVYEGVNWYFSNDGKVSLQNPATGGSGTTYNSYWWSINLDGRWFRTPEEAAAYNYFSNYGWTTTTANFNTVIGNANGAVVADVTYYLCSGSACGSTPKTARAYAGVPSNTSCAVGQGVSGSGTCFSTGLNSTNFSVGVPKTDLVTAYNNLTTTVKEAPLSKSLAAELANRLWRDAASQPDFVGVPWSSSSPVADTDFSPYFSSQGSSWPKTSQLGTSVPTTAPVVSPESNPNAMPTASPGATKIDLGVDPGTPSPTLAEPPSDLFKPINDLLNPWLSWTVPGHATDCPTWQASPSIAGHVFEIDLSHHCAFVENYRALILAASLACWTVVAAFIVLSA